MFWSCQRPAPLYPRRRYLFSHIENQQQMSTTTSIKCPKCGHRFNVSEAFEHSIQEGRAQHEEAIRREALQMGLNPGSARERAAWKVSNEELQKDLEAAKSALGDSQKVELQARRDMQQLEEDKRNFELIVQRAVDEERTKREQAAEIRAGEKFQSKITNLELEKADLNNLVEQLKKNAEDSKRKAEQGSQQRQGAALETAFEEQLRRAFPQDKITEIVTGARGADIMQQITTASGRPAGVILYETKRTKNWSDGWLIKLKEDMRKTGARIGVIVTEALPADMFNTAFALRDDDVGVCDLNSAIVFARVLQRMIEREAEVRGYNEGRNDKEARMYALTTGPVFKQLLRQINETFVRLRNNREKLRKATLQSWSTDDELIEIILDGQAEMVGRIEAISNTVVPDIALLDLAEPSEINGRQHSFADINGTDT
jgi:hypothetical protein